MSSEWGQLRRETFVNMEARFRHWLHRKWGMVEDDVRAFEGFIDRDGRYPVEPIRWPDDVRQRWLATMQGVDYVNTQHEGDYGDAWTLPDADLCVDKSDGGLCKGPWLLLCQCLRQSEAAATASG